MSRSARVRSCGFPWFHLLTGSLSCTSLLVLALSLACADSEGESIAPDRFLREYRDALRDLQSMYADVIVTGEHKVVGPARTKSTQFTYISSGKNEKMHLWREKPDYFDRVFVIGENREFQVIRRTPSGSYYLENVSDSGEGWRPFLLDMKFRSRGAAYCPVGLGEFPGFVNSHVFVIKQVSRVSEGGTPLLNVDFEFNPSDKGEFKLKGWFRADPQQALVIRSYDIEVRTPILQGKKAGQELISHSQGRMAYRDENGKPAPTENHSTMFKDGRVVREDHYTFSKFSFESAPPVEFTLAAFGLGDIERTAREIETRNNYWTAALAVAAILMSLLLFRAGRSFQKRRAAERESVPAVDPSLEGSPGGQGT
jgi:hypothetical protein